MRLSLLYIRLALATMPLIACQSILAQTRTRVVDPQIGKGDDTTIAHALSSAGSSPSAHWTVLVRARLHQHWTNRFGGQG